jgi:hypothetical protein
MILLALGRWAVSALALLCLFSAVLTHINAGERAVAYASSALSFLAAVGAGSVIGGTKGDKIVYPVLLTAAVLVTILLTIGFMVEGSAIESGGVLSVVSFSFAGCLVGAVIFMGGKHKNQKKHKLRYRK